MFNAALMFNAASDEDEDDLPQTCNSTWNVHTEVMGHSPVTPSSMQEGPGATPASLAAPGKSPLDPCHWQCSSTTLLALSSWGWEHSLPVWGTLGLSAPSHPTWARCTTATTTSAHCSPRGHLCLSFPGFTAFKGN